MNRRYFFIVGMVIFFSGLSCVLYSIIQINDHAKEENHALNVAKASTIDKPSFKNIPESKNDQVLIEYDFKKGDVIGILKIPRLEREVPIIEGTDGKELKKGVGHYSTTFLPEQKNQIFLAGHRDTVFKNMGELQSGDILSIVMPSGTYLYEIFKTYIVDEHDTSVIRQTNPQEILTLSTCYPFNIFGSSRERYIIEAKRTNQKPLSLGEKEVE